MSQTTFNKTQLPSDSVFTTASQALTNKTYNGVNLLTGGSATQYLNANGLYSVPAGATIPSTTSILKGDNTGNAIAATAGTDYVIPSGTVATATTSNGLNSATTTIVVNSATAPISGQVLTATGPNAANWQTPSGGGGSNPWTLLKKTTNQSTTSGSNVSVNELTFSATIGKTYHIRGLIITNVNISTASMFFGNSSGSGGVLTTAAGYSSFMVRSTTSTNMVYSQPGNQGWPGIATGYVMVRIEVSFTAAATGTFAFDFSVASSNTATIYAGSYIEYMQVN